MEEGQFGERNRERRERVLAVCGLCPFQGR
jgi:hypothetical protein